jgi:hypothetical protein
MGAGARRLQPSMLLFTGAGGGGPAPGGGPDSLDWANIWDPVLQDSFNQEAVDTVLDEQWTLYPNGTVQHFLHFQNMYAISGRYYAAYPFDKPIYVATRRAFNTPPSEVKFTIVRQGTSMPQEMDAWKMLGVGLESCLVHELAADDPSDCGAPGAAPCSDMLVLWMQLSRLPSGPIQSMIVPITLVIVLIGSAFYTNIDAYDARSLIMGTSMIALMAVSAPCGAG